MTWAGKRVLVTGGANGIGAAAVELFAELGATVVIADVAEEAGKALAEKLGGQHCFIRLDVSSRADWERCLPSIAPQGRLDLAIFNAGVMTRPHGENQFNDPLPWMTDKTMERLVGVNIFGSLWGCLTCLPAVEAAQGTMMVVSSAAGIRALAIDPAYAMTKFALVGWGMSLAATLADSGMRVITVCPHNVDTPMVPPDVKARNDSMGYSSPPSHMAQSILHIYENGVSGQVWQSRAGDLPYVVDTPPPYSR